MEDSINFNINESDISTDFSNKDSSNVSYLLKKCIELLSFPNEPQYSDVVENLFKESNELFIKKYNDDENFNAKKSNLEKYIDTIKKKKKIEIKDFKKIQEFAISKGGFITSDNRKCLYKKIYLLNHSNIIKMLYIDYNARTDRNWDFDKLDIFSEKRICDDVMNSSKYDFTINKDCERSKIFRIINGKDNNGKKISKLISQDLEKYIKLIFCLNNNIYSYTQGIHDVGLFFLLLYHKTPHYAVAVFQRFIEFNLKELLNINYNEKKMDHGTYKMIELYDALMILKYIINLLDPKVKSFFEDIEKKENISIEDDEGESNVVQYPICDFAIKWIISLFNTQITDINKIYRIFDYLIVSHPLAIYFLCAEIIIDYYYKLDDKTILNNKEKQLDYYINKINFDDIDFDYYIEQCEKNLRLIDNSKFNENLKLNEFCPMINKQLFVEKWIMINNKEEYKNNFSFLKFLFQRLLLIKNLLVNSNDKSNSKNEEEETNNDNIK